MKPKAEGRLTWPVNKVAFHWHDDNQNESFFFYVYGSVHHNIFFEITNRYSYMQ